MNQNRFLDDVTARPNFNYYCRVHGSVYVPQLCVLQVSVETNWKVSNIPTFTTFTSPTDIQARAFNKGPQRFPADPKIQKNRRNVTITL